MATLKQKAVAKDLLENAGKPVSRAMLDAGYSPATAKNPDELTNSKGWSELMNEYFPDSELAKVGQDGLKATKVITSHTEPDFEVPDHPTRHKYWETVLKMKKYIGADTQVNNVTFARVVNEDKDAFGI